MSAQTILVIGATGTVGGPVARQLRACGYHVRLLVRDVERAQTQLGSDFEYIAGRVEESEPVEQALAGCSGVLISLQAGSNPEEIERVEYQGAIRIIELAVKQPGMHLAYVSGMFVRGQFDHGVLADQAKGRVEQAIQESGNSFTIFRPSYFMDNLPKHLQGKRALVLGKQPHPLHLVAASDFGRMVSRAFQAASAANKTFYIQGPEALTLVDALRIYCSMLEPEKRVTTIPLSLMSMLDTLFLGKQMRRTLETMQVLQHYGELGDPSEANRVLGAPTTTLRAWCEQQRLHRSGESKALADEQPPAVSKEAEQ